MRYGPGVLVLVDRGGRPSGWYRLARRSFAPTVTRTPARIERNDAEVVEVSFDTPVDQAAPGQSLVLYRGDEILGGGIVRRAA